MTLVRVIKSPVIWMLLAAMLPHARFQSLDLGRDAPRYLYQAEALRSGKGLVRYAYQSLPAGHVDRPETGLPPGYSVFLAAVMIGCSVCGLPFLESLHVIQVLMAVVACYLVYEAIRPRSNLLAVGVFLALAAFPELHVFAAGVNSEVLGFFLSTLLAFLVSRFETDGPSWFRCFAIGSVAVALLLTSPALIVLSFLVWCYAAWRIRLDVPLLVSLALGSLMLMVPWQLHCYRSTGQIQWSVYKLPADPSSHSEFTRWYRTWATREFDMCIFWLPELIDELPPPSVFSPAEKQELPRLYIDAWPKQKREQFSRDFDPAWISQGYDSRTEPYLPPPLEEAFGRAADRRIAAEPWHYYLILPLRRAVSIWAFRIPRHNAGDFVIGLVGNIFNLIIMATVLSSVILTVRSRNGLPILIALAIILYTAVSAFSAMGEERRNIPFYPMILFTLFYATRNGFCDDADVASE